MFCTHHNKKRTPYITYSTLGVGRTSFEGEGVSLVLSTGQPSSVVVTGKGGVTVASVLSDFVSLDVTSSAFLDFDSGTLHQVKFRCRDLVDSVTVITCSTSSQSRVDTERSCLESKRF